MDYQVLYVYAGHSKQMISYLNKWRIPQYCDIILIACDIEICTHKLLLSACSPYFRAMFANFDEGHKKRIVLKDIDGIILQILIDYMYTGEITVDEDNAQDLLQAANYLQLKLVKDLCCEFIESNLQTTNCLGIAALADTFECESLLVRANMHMHGNFKELVKCEEFLLANFLQVLNLITNDRLLVSKEEEVFESVMLWVTYNLSEREALLSDLLEHVRLPFISEKYLSEKVAEEPLIKNNPSCMYYVREAMQYYLLDHNQKKLFISPRAHKRISKVILLIGGSSSIPDNIGWFDIKQQDSFTSLTKILNNRTLFGATVTDGRIYLFGGQVDKTVVGSMDIFDYVNSTWSIGASMHRKRKYFGVATVDNVIYAIGGIGEDENHPCYVVRSPPLKVAEKYDIKSSKWKMIAPMTVARHQVSVGVLNGQLYAVGGTGVECPQQNAMTSVERYCPKVNQWNDVANMLYGRTGAGVAVLDGLLYAFGGQNSHLENQNTAEVYDPRLNKWSRIPDMKIKRSDAGVVALDGCLCVFGGDDRSTTETFTPRTNCWTVVSTVTQMERYFHRLALIPCP